MRVAPRFLSVAALVAVLLGTSGVAEASPQQPAQADQEPRYYLALGDSLAVGIQADSQGDSIPTDEGYADQLHRRMASTMPELQLVKLGCSGETTATMINGGVCEYDRGSQLAQAVDFLRTHRGSVALVTIDIGANDVAGCLGASGIDLPCAAGGAGSAAGNLARILAELRLAGGWDTHIVGANYYNPYLARWLQGAEGQALARTSVEIQVLFNDLLEKVYRVFHVPVADVEQAFSTTDFSTIVTLPEVGPVPLNVARVCQWTWMCAPPREPNIHPNTEGYRVIASAFEVLVATP
jgi:lysophospholipase L1-like esterase